MVPTLRHRNVLLALLTLTIVGGGAYLFFRFEMNQQGLAEAALSLTGSSKERALTVLGQPIAVHSGQTFNAEKLPGVRRSYEPDPPYVECDEVLEYRAGTRLVLVFCVRDVVVRVYTGLT